MIKLGDLVDFYALNRTTCGSKSQDTQMQLIGNLARPTRHCRPPLWDIDLFKDEKKNASVISLTLVGLHHRPGIPCPPLII